MFVCVKVKAGVDLYWCANQNSKDSFSVVLDATAELAGTLIQQNHMLIQHHRSLVDLWPEHQEHRAPCCCLTIAQA